MIISDLNYLETAEGTVEGGWIFGNSFTSRYTQTDNVNFNFTSNNNFNTHVYSNYARGNSASAGAKGDAINPFPPSKYGAYGIKTDSYTKADTIAVTELWGGSFSGSSSAAVINLAH